MRVTKHISAFIFFALLLVLILYSTIKNSNFIPLTDSGIFQYIGQQILNGDIPYKDLWDHKGPLLYYINAIGVLLDYSYISGIWLVEFLFLFGSALLSFYLFKREFSLTAAFFGTFGWIITLTYIIDGGNLTEEYALLFQFAALFAYSSTLRVNKITSWDVIFGVSLACVMLLRPNLIGVHFPIILSMMILSVYRKQILAFFLKLLVSFFSFLAVLGIFAGYFYSQGALGHLFDQFFSYNFMYSGADFEGQLRVIYYGLEVTNKSIMAVISIAVWLILVVTFLANRMKLNELENGHLLLVGLIGLPMSFYLLSMSGRSYHHYFISLLPYYGLMAAFFSHFLRDVSLKLGPLKNGKLIVILCLTFAISFNPVKQMKETVEADKRYDPREVVIQYIKDNTAPDDYLFVWGAFGSIYYETERKAPTKYLYYFPLIDPPGYATHQDIEGFLDDIKTKQPEIILDTLKNKESLAQSGSPLTALYEDILETEYQRVEGFSEGVPWDVYKKR